MRWLRFLSLPYSCLILFIPLWWFTIARLSSMDIVFHVLVPLHLYLFRFQSQSQCALSIPNTAPYWITTKSNLIFFSIRLAHFERDFHLRNISTSNVGTLSLSLSARKNVSNSSFIEVAHKIDVQFATALFYSSRAFFVSFLFITAISVGSDDNKNANH